MPKTYEDLGNGMVRVTDEGTIDLKPLRQQLRELETLINRGFNPNEVRAFGEALAEQELAKLEAEAQALRDLIAEYSPTNG